MSKDERHRLLADRFLSVAAAARRLGCSPATVRRWIAEGLLAAFQAAPGKQHHIRRADLDALLSGSDRSP